MRGVGVRLPRFKVRTLAENRRVATDFRRAFERIFEATHHRRRRILRRANRQTNVDDDRFGVFRRKEHKRQAPTSNQTEARDEHAKREARGGVAMSHAIARKAQICTLH